MAGVVAKDAGVGHQLFLWLEPSDLGGCAQEEQTNDADSDRQTTKKLSYVRQSQGHPVFRLTNDMYLQGSALGLLSALFPMP